MCFDPAVILLPLEVAVLAAPKVSWPHGDPSSTAFRQRGTQPWEALEESSVTENGSLKNGKEKMVDSICLSFIVPGWYGVYIQYMYIYMYHGSYYENKHI